MADVWKIGQDVKADEFYDKSKKVIYLLQKVKVKMQKLNLHEFLLLAEKSMQLIC